MKSGVNAGIAQRRRTQLTRQGLAAMAAYLVWFGATPATGATRGTPHPAGAPHGCPDQAEVSRVRGLVAQWEQQVKATTALPMPSETKLAGLLTDELTKEKAAFSYVKNALSAVINAENLSRAYLVKMADWELAEEQAEGLARQLRQETDDVADADAKLQSANDSKAAANQEKRESFVARMRADRKLARAINASEKDEVIANLRLNLKDARDMWNRAETCLVDAARRARMAQETYTVATNHLAFTQNMKQGMYNVATAKYNAVQSARMSTEDSCRAWMKAWALYQGSSAKANKAAAAYEKAAAASKPQPPKQPDPATDMFAAMKAIRDSLNTVGEEIDGGLAQQIRELRDTVRFIQSSTSGSQVTADDAAQGKAEATYVDTEVKSFKAIVDAPNTSRRDYRHAKDSLWRSLRAVQLKLEVIASHLSDGSAQSNNAPKAKS